MSSRIPGRSLLVVLLLTSGSVANAIDAGEYVCRISSAVGVNAEGETVELPHAPGEFRLEAADAPVTGSELRRGGPHRGLDYYDAEQPPAFSASVDARLFERMMTGLRSQDGATYSQNENSVVFSADGRFLAFGLAIRDHFIGVAVYSGNCRRL